MKNNLRISIIAVLILAGLMILCNSCKREDEKICPAYIDFDWFNRSWTGITETALDTFVFIIRDDCYDKAISGIKVNFIVGQGSLSVTSAVTDENGKVSTVWTLGPDIGKQRFTMSVKADHSEPGFSTLATAVAKTVEDVDGNIYNVEIIKNLVWMDENLKVTRYSDETEIPFLEDNTEWANLTAEDSAYCFYNNNANGEGDTYGVLYTWAAAMRGADANPEDPDQVQGVCPDGWQLPSKLQWEILAECLGGEDIAGGKLKEFGTAHWNSPNTGADNENDLRWLPGGVRSNVDGTFNNLGNIGSWWSTSEEDGNIIQLNLHYNKDRADISNYSDKSCGVSVRCIRSTN